MSINLQINKKNMNTLKKNLKISILSLLSALIGAFVFYFIIKDKLIVSSSDKKVNLVTTNYNTAAFSTNGIENEVNFISAATKTVNAVVHVKNTSTASNTGSIFDFLYGSAPQEYERVGTGSGVIVSPDGYIITNNHVIENANSIEITTNENKTYQAELIGTDAATDIAVLKINTSDNLEYIYFGNSDQTQIGEWVLAVGNPFNLNSTVTAGIISAKSRDLDETDNKNQSFIQTDAAVNSGNSGGALVNVRGELIGINTAIGSYTGAYVGYSFAVPSNIARKVFEDIMEYGNVQKGLLGVTGQALNSALAERLNIENTTGFYVANVQEDMGAKEAGIEKGDIIVAIDDVTINKFADMSGYLSTKRPGNNVKITIIREDAEKEINVLLKKINYTYFWGMQLMDIKSKEYKKYNVKSGVKITQMNNERLIQRTEIREDYLIYSINNTPIKSIQDLENVSLREISSITFVSPEGKKSTFVF